MMRRRRLRGETVPVAQAASAEDGTVLSLDYHAFDAASGDRPCASNDNEDPYEWNCTEVLSRMPSPAPLGRDSRDGDDDELGGGGYGSGAGSADGKGSRDGGNRTDKDGSGGVDGETIGGGESIGASGTGSGSGTRGEADAAGDAELGSGGDSSDEGSGGSAIEGDPFSSSSSSSSPSSLSSASSSSSSSPWPGEPFVGDPTYGISSYAYSCVSDRYCNTNLLGATHPPGNLLGLGWEFDGHCERYADCPPDYDEGRATAQGYENGDRATITSDYLNGKVIGSISCPGPRGGLGWASGGKTDRWGDGDRVVTQYVYEVESSEASTASVFLPRLEEQILLSLADRMMSCLGGERALLREGRIARRSRGRALGEDGGAEFSVGGIASSPDDVAVSEGEGLYARC